MAPKDSVDTPKQAARHVEAAFDKSFNGADKATDTLIHEINQNPRAANKIIKQIRHDDKAHHDNVLPSIALTEGERLLTGTGPLDTDIGDVLTRANLKSIKGAPPGSSAGENAVMQMSAGYLSKNYWQIAGCASDGPDNADGTDQHIPIMAMDMSRTAEGLPKQPGWNKKPKVQHLTLGEKIYYAVDRIMDPPN